MSADTQKINCTMERSDEIRSTLQEIYLALQEKGYSPIIQLSGYILSGDPTYITNHNQARIRIQHLDREELLQELVRAYLQDEK